MNSSYTTMISNPLKPGKNFRFSVRRLNQTLSRKKKKIKNRVSIPHNFTFYPIIQIQTSFSPDVFRLLLKLLPNNVIQLDDSTRHARAITSHRSLQPCEKRNNPWYNVTRERNIDARGESANMTIRRES